MSTPNDDLIRNGIPGDADAIDIVVIPRARDLGGFRVKRALPSSTRRMVGPFVFLDQMGPAALAPGEGMDVRPHPHIGLATLTYLFDGEVMHRDSLGNEIAIRPGELNWMTAGRGIVHSERTPLELRTTGSKLAGIQSWVALDEAHEEMAPAFVHHDASEMPFVTDTGIRARVVVGSMAGAASPVETSTPTLYADVALEPAASFPVDADYEERAIYTVGGRVSIGGEAYDAEQLLVFRPGDRLTVTALDGGARFMVLGGDAMGPRHIWWNFVSSRAERIEQAKEDWKAGRFGKVPNDDEFIPLPEPDPKPVYYP